MADKELRVRLEADDKITPAAKKAKGSLDDIPDKKTVTVEAKGLDDLTSKVGGLPGPLGEAGELIGQLGAAGGVGALAAGMFAAADAAADLAIEAQTTADLTGSTVEDASKLQNLWGRTGADVNDLNDVLLQMNGVLQQSPELAKQIGVNLNDGKDITQRFVEVTDLLASGQLSAVQASQLFGEEGVRQVGKLRTMYGGLADDLENMPAPVDEEDVAQAIEMKKAVADLKNVLTTTVGIVGKELVPLFGDMAELANNVADALPGGKEGGGADALKFIREYGTGIGLIAKGFAAIAGGPGIDVKLDESIDNLANYQAQVEAAADAAAAAAGPTADWGGIVKDAGEGAALAARDMTALNEATQAGVDAATAYVDALNGMADARRAAADSAFAANAADREYVDTLIEAETQLREHPDLLRENAAALEGVAVAAGKNADAQVRLAADQAAATGQTLDATESQSVWNRSMLNSAKTTSGPMHDAIINYIAAVNGIPPEKVSDILADTQYATIDEANRALDTTTRQREADVRAQAINIPPTESALNDLARDRTATIYARAVTSGIAGAFAGAAAPRTATATTTGATAGTYTAPTATTYAPAPIYINVPAPPPTSISFNTPAVGGRFDIDRAVTKALRRHQRFNGRRP